MPKKSKVIQKKKLHDLVVNWYDCYRDERFALHRIAVEIPFKAYHNSGALSYMFEEIMKDKKLSKSQMNKIVTHMFHLINDYTDKYFKEHPDAVMEDLDKVSDDELYS